MEASSIENEQTSTKTTTSLIVGLYVVLIVTAEAVVAFVGVVPGVILDASLVFLLLNSFFFRKDSHGEVFLVLALVPMLRIFSLVVPVALVSQIDWYIMSGVPLLLATMLVARFFKPSWTGFRLERREWALQVLIASSGLPLAAVACLILRPGSLFRHLNWQEALVSSLILILFSGFSDELIFRSMLQPALQGIYGRYGLLLSSVLYASMFLGSHSPGFVLLMSLVGLLFGYSAEQTGSIWGAVTAHSILSIGLILILPVLWY